MNSPGRRRQTLRASEIHAGEGIRIIAIESLRLDVQKFAPCYQMFARIEPAAMVVCVAGEDRVIGLASADISLEDLKRDVPGLRALLEAAGE